MSKFELKLPKMGESVAEATITGWLKEVGETIELDEAIVEIATDKVDSEVPSEVEGVLIERLFDVDDVVEVGKTIAIIETNSTSSKDVIIEAASLKEDDKPIIPSVDSVKAADKKSEEILVNLSSPTGKFYSPLVRNIAKKEKISMDELESIVGSGKDNRVTKNDILSYLANRGKPKTISTDKAEIKVSEESTKVDPIAMKLSGGDEIIEMTRMGKLIAKHMVDSVHTAAHVQSFIEVDVTNIVKWRNRVKDDFFTGGRKNYFYPNFYGGSCKSH